MDVKKVDKIITKFLQSIGPWNDIIVIGGGYALIIYKLYLTNDNLENLPVGTKDTDSLIPRQAPTVCKDLSMHLEEAGFIHKYKDLNHPATESYLKHINGQEVEIEFLTDTATRTDKYKKVQIAGIVAQPLNYLTMSLQAPHPFRTYSGQSGWVVNPGAWVFHKGLTFVKRQDAFKLYKDLYGIWYVLTQLGDFSEETATQLTHLGAQHPKWFKTWQKNLQNWLSTATPLEWTKLENQDPSGLLIKDNFIKTAQKIIQIAF